MELGSGESCNLSYMEVDREMNIEHFHCVLFDGDCNNCNGEYLTCCYIRKKGGLSVLKFIDKWWILILVILFSLMIGYSIGLERGYTQAFIQCEADAKKILDDHKATKWLRR